MEPGLSPEDDWVWPRNQGQNTKHRFLGFKRFSREEAADPVSIPSTIYCLLSPTRSNPQGSPLNTDCVTPNTNRKISSREIESKSLRVSGWRKRFTDGDNTEHLVGKIKFDHLNCYLDQFYYHFMLWLF